MGCGDPREKVENEMVKMKMERIVIQMERQKQLKLLKDIDGVELNIQKIPDYIDDSAYTNQITKRNKKFETESASRNMKKLKLKKSKSLNPKEIKKVNSLQTEGIKRKKHLI